MSALAYFLAALTFSVPILSPAQKPKPHWFNWSGCVQLPVHADTSAWDNLSNVHIKRYQQVLLLLLLSIIVAAPDIFNGLCRWDVCLSCFHMGSVQLIQAECFAFGTLSIAGTQADNRAICFLQEAVQTAALGSLGCTRQAMNWWNPSGQTID